MRLLQPPTGRNLILVNSLILLLLATPANASGYCDTCDRDKHGRIKRSVTAKAEFKRLHPCPSTGNPKGACPGYVIDHIQALKRGGKDKPDNMQWQTTAAAKEKDKWE